MNPYTPSSAPAVSSPPKPRLQVWGMVIGALLFLAPVFGMLGTVMGLTRAFGALESSGADDPAVLSDSIGFSLVSTAVGLLLCPVGLLILILSLVSYFRRKAAIRSAAPPSGESAPP